MAGSCERAPEHAPPHTAAGLLGGAGLARAGLARAGVGAGGSADFSGEGCCASACEEDRESDLDAEIPGDRAEIPGDRVEIPGDRADLELERDACEGDLEPASPPASPSPPSPPSPPASPASAASPASPASPTSPASPAFSGPRACRVPSPSCLASHSLTRAALGGGSAGENTRRAAGGGARGGS